MEYRLDMSMMFAVHDALRRDLERIARTSGRSVRDPGARLQAVLGWGLFKKFLSIHHESEDVAVWPTLREHVAESPDRVALVAALEAEHAEIDPLLEAIDAAAHRPDAADRFGDLLDALTTSLTKHLAHEESEGLALIDATLTPQEWKQFSDVHRARIGEDRRLYMPWLLDEASPQTLETILGGFPEQLLSAYREQWGPAYAAMNLWDVDRRAA